MSHEHDLAGRVDPVDPALLARDDVRAFLAVQDIGGLYRTLTENGWSQYRIAPNRINGRCHAFTAR